MTLVGTVTLVSQLRGGGGPRTHSRVQIRALSPAGGRATAVLLGTPSLSLACVSDARTCVACGQQPGGMGHLTEARMGR